MSGMPPVGRALCALTVSKKRECDNYPWRRSSGVHFGPGSGHSSEPTARGRGPCACQDPHWGPGRVALGPCALRTAALPALITSPASPVLLGYVKLRGQTRVYLGFCLFFVFGFLLFGTVCPLTAKSVL